MAARLWARCAFTGLCLHPSIDYGLLRSQKYCFLGKKVSPIVQSTSPVHRSSPPIVYSLAKETLSTSKAVAILPALSRKNSHGLRSTKSGTAHAPLSPYPSAGMGIAAHAQYH